VDVARLHEILVASEEILSRRANLVSVVHGLDSCRKPLWECLSARLDPIVAKALALKVLNLCLAKYHFRSRHTQVLSRPFGLIMDPSNFCNLACPGCVHSAHSQELRIFDWEKGLMPENRVAALFQTHAPYAIQTIFSNYGEPLMNPDTPKLIRLAKSYLMSAMLSTNMTVGLFDAEALVLSGLDYMVLSIDGATQPVYEKFRRTGNLQVVFRNLRMLVEAKRRLGRQTPAIAWHFLAFEHNAHEIPQALELARQLGVNRFEVLTPFDVSWDDPAIRPAAVKPFAVEIDPHDEAAMAGNLNSPPGGLDRTAIEREFEVRWAERAAQTERHGRWDPPSGMTCHWLYKSMSMDARGRVFPCCGAPTRDRDLVFAQFDGASGSDPYNSPKYRLARLSFANPEAYRSEWETGHMDQEPYCARCEWQKTTPNTDVPEIRQFLRASAGDLFGAPSLDLLSSW
jgi:MoaA/NifB/PqqE/SkfB family radical SAM enzyme